VITVLKINRLTKEISGWLMAANFNEAAGKAGAAGESDLANYCYTHEFTLDQRSDARFDLPVNESGTYIYTVLQ